jgi:hypothetical protein
MPPTTQCDPARSTPAYRRMCHFQSIEAHRLLEEMGFEYHFRLDADSLLTHPITIDPIQQMHDNNQLYAYALAVRVSGVCMSGYPEAVAVAVEGKASRSVVS